jgi:hypothetical protein
MRIRILFRLCSHKKLNFYTKNILYVRNSHKHDQLGIKDFLKGLKSGSFVSFSKFPGSMIRIRISNTDTEPDPEELPEINADPFGSGS